VTRRILVALALLAVAGLGRYGWPVLVADEELAFDRREVELGAMYAGQVVKTTVTATNVGRRPVELANLQGGCACVAQAFVPGAILPGDSRDIVIELDTRQLSKGPLTRHVTFDINGRQQLAYTITLNGEILHEFDVSPGFIDFGAASLGTTDRRTVEFRVRRVGVTLRGIRATTDVVDIDELTRTPQHLSVALSLKKAAAQGEIYGVLIVETSSEYNPEIRVPLLGKVG
jgi:hypothetical protein